MLQRVLISKKENIKPNDDYYDCIFSEGSTYKNLLEDWLWYEPDFGTYVGPWKIIIRDNCLMDQFMEEFNKLIEYAPRLRSLNDIWAVHDENGNLIHISEKEDKYFFSIIEKNYKFVFK